MPKKLITSLSILLLLALFLLYINWHGQALPDDAIADQVLIEKSERRLTLLREGKVLKQYRVALGKQPVGDKEQEGDRRTPEGEYKLDWRNTGSRYHLSLHISYPDRSHTEQARAKGVSPGGDIMIHGLRDGMGWIGKLHRMMDWTNGCIAVTNPETEEIGRAVRDGTPIKIAP